MNPATRNGTSKSVRLFQDLITNSEFNLWDPIPRLWIAKGSEKYLIK